MRTGCDQSVSSPILDHIGSHIRKSIIRFPDGAGAIKQISFPNTRLGCNECAGIGIRMEQGPANGHVRQITIAGSPCSSSIITSPDIIDVVIRVDRQQVLIRRSDRDAIHITGGTCGRDHGCSWCSGMRIIGTNHTTRSHSKEYSVLGIGRNLNSRYILSGEIAYRNNCRSVTRLGVVPAKKSTGIITGIDAVVDIVIIPRIDKSTGCLTVHRRTPGSAIICAASIYVEDV